MSAGEMQAPIGHRHAGLRLAWRVAGYALLVLIALSVLIPLFYTLNTGLKPPSEFVTNTVGLVHGPTLSNFSYLWDRIEVLVGLRNSLMVAGGTIVLLWICASMAGFAVSKMRFPFRLTFFVLVLSSGMVPLQTILAPIYQELHEIGLLDTYIGLILVYTAFGMPLSVFLFAAYFNGIPAEVIEAARMDGASPMRTWFQVVLPMAKPALAITAIIAFVMVFDDFLTPLLVMQSPEKQLFVVKVAQALGRNPEPTKQAAGLIIGMLPLLIVFFFGQRFLIKGITAGAVK